MPIFDHVAVSVRDSERAKAFYEKALAPLGIKLLMQFGTACGFGRDGKPELWIGEGPAAFQKREDIAIITPIHIAFRASDRAMVNAFHAAAIAAGGRDFGKPGIREMYHPNYYGAFVLDLDGHNIEAVCHV